VNYRHAYHAGNFADVLKHAVLARIVIYLTQKPAPFRVIDTHAGIGLYDLTSAAAQKTGEWRDGIGRLQSGKPLPAGAAELLAPYLAVVRGLNPDGGLTRYPGSPLLARRLMRDDDQLIASELHPDDHAALRRTLFTEPASKTMALDGYTALRALLPPRERRGLVLIDPPFEAADETERLVAAAGDVRRRFATGSLMIWHPIKDVRAVTSLHRALAAVGFAKTLAVSLLIRAPRRADVLNGCGLVIVNPPYTLETELAALLPVLTERLAQDAGARFELAPLLR
jgi:23S rRNA (adenine2030-N6)-methyltransferase